MAISALAGGSRGPPETDVGHVRLLQRPALGLFAVAHGLGASAVAAELTVEILEGSVRASRALAREGPTADSSSALLDAAIQNAQAAWAARVNMDPSLDGVGSTLVAVLRDTGEIAVAHLGDCAALVLRQGVVVRRTLNHTLRRECKESAGQDLGAGEFDRVVLRAIGMPQDPEVQTWKVAPDDVVLLTAGVHDLLSDPDFARLHCNDPREFVQRLMAEASSHEFKDDIAALAFRADG
jgi:serine/threonine protein phosphatase PrpC